MLLRASLADAADERAERRRRREQAAAGPLPPRPVRGDDAREAVTHAAPRPLLRSVRPRSGAPSRRRASSTRPPAPRRQRVLDAVAGLNFDRLVPGDDEARARRAALLRRAGTRLAVGAVAVLLVLGVFPVRMWMDQRTATDRSRERLEVFERENELLEEERRDLNTDARIEQEAREMGMVLPGEESYRVMPAPTGTVPPPADTTTSESEPDG